jgi:hypothetical protein
MGFWKRGFGRQTHAEDEAYWRKQFATDPIRCQLTLTPGRKVVKLPGLQHSVNHLSARH